MSTGVGTGSGCGSGVGLGSTGVLEFSVLEEALVDSDVDTEVLSLVVVLSVVDSLVLVDPVDVDSLVDSEVEA